MTRIPVHTVDSAPEGSRWTCQPRRRSDLTHGHADRSHSDRSAPRRTLELS